MKYEIFFKPKSIKDLKELPKKESEKILSKIEELGNNLNGDVKKLTNHTPEYRARIGNYRVLFEIEKDQIVIYRIKHRKDVYN
ncbi:MAG: plasmid stabilization protein [Spirochaetes bacterium GWB1_36_13]|nr:MAG: plasmid stabilization protein [Spirochaetes bacterium GWB1_36_13]